jgi:hypothetical protein
MNRKSSLGLLLFLAVLTGMTTALAPGCASAARDAKKSVPTAWSTTSPAVNETHLFEGYINRKGDPVGYHSRPGGRDPATARVVSVVDPPNKVGVYTAMVEIHAPKGRWLSKQSTLFPDNMSRKEVIQAVLHSFQNRTSGNATRFSGPSNKGFTIEGYLLPDGRINTAFPIYRHD